MAIPKFCDALERTIDMSETAENIERLAYDGIDKVFIVPTLSGQFPRSEWNVSSRRRDMVAPDDDPIPDWDDYGDERNWDWSYGDDVDSEGSDWIDRVNQALDRVNQALDRPKSPIREAMSRERDKVKQGSSR